MKSTPHSNDDRISAMIAASDYRPMTPAQEAEANDWLASRIAVVRRSHQLFPSPPQGDGETITARTNYQRANMNCDPHYNHHVPTSHDREIMRRMRNKGATICRIAKSLGFDKRTVAKTVSQVVRESA